MVCGRNHEDDDINLLSREDCGGLDTVTDEAGGVDRRDIYDTVVK